MKITRRLFEAYIKCPMKCWLRSIDEPTSSDRSNLYAGWIDHQNETYRARLLKQQMMEGPSDQYAIAAALTDVKSTKWRLALDVRIETSNLDVRLDVVERIPTGRGKATQFIPGRFLFTNKLTKDDRLSVAFDALALSMIVGRNIPLGKIIHGERHTSSIIRLSEQTNEVRQRISKITTMLSSAAPPELVLNRHCAECEYRWRCRQRAEEQDDLSLLSTMTSLERKKLNERGVLTVKQHSYAFLPRRRPKRLQDKPEKYHTSLKALAIRENKIHVVGNSQLKIKGTPVILDVEGMPDREFYYLIGLRVIKDGSLPVQHSLWADRIEDEAKIYAEMLE